MDDGGARRWQTMIRHAMHTFAAALWAVGLAGVLRAQPGAGGPTSRAMQVVLALLLVATYVAGLVAQRRHPAWARRRRSGAAWVCSMVLLWAVLVALGATWAWLCFPLLFLVLFILPRPASLLVVLAASLWTALSPLLRGGRISSGSVLGPLFGAGVAVVVALVFEQLRRDAQTQRQLNAEVARLAADQARVAEREALARDLHDTLAQGLNSIVMLARAARAQHPQAAEHLDGIEQVARENLAQTRTLVRRMAPPQASRLADDLATVVQAVQAEQRLVGSGLDVEVRSSGDPQPTSGAVHQTVVMAARTLLANVVQHARARRCVVTITWLDDVLCLDVVDDGVGFDPARVGGDSYGLRALRSRIAEVGGSVEVDSTSEGTSVGLVVPVTTGESDD